MGSKIAWNRDKTACAMLINIREFTIRAQPDGRWKVEVWYQNQSTAFSLGLFDTKPEAERFLRDIMDKW